MTETSLLRLAEFAKMDGFVALERMNRALYKVNPEMKESLKHWENICISALDKLASYCDRSNDQSMQHHAILKELKDLLVKRCGFMMDLVDMTETNEAKKRMFPSVRPSILPLELPKLEVWKYRCWTGSEEFFFPSFGYENGCLIVSN